MAMIGFVTGCENTIVSVPMAAPPSSVIWLPLPGGFPTPPPENVDGGPRFGYPGPRQLFAPTSPL
jgi:hypothetical protein